MIITHTRCDALSPRIKEIKITQAIGFAVGPMKDGHPTSYSFTNMVGTVLHEDFDKRRDRLVVTDGAHKLFDSEIK